MYTDIENQVNKIMQSLRMELQISGIIDKKTGKILNLTYFKYIVVSKINELKKLERLVVDKDGVAINRYGTNIWLNAISKLQNMLQHESLNPQKDELLRIPDMADEKMQKTPIIKQIFHKIFGPKTR